MTQTSVIKRSRLACAIAVVCLPMVGHAQLEEVVVTAQKRAQSANDVPIAISAFTGDRLKDLGVLTPADLARITPGLTYNPSTQSNAPIYAIRGVGFTDESVQASSTVGVYLDEIAFPYPVMTRGTMFDLERVEVLKGPQGTLYGLNTTGGAINHFANRPTDNLEAGITATYGRFEQYDIEGFISGPLSDNLRARLALKQVGAGEGWQESVTSGEELGEQGQTAARLLIDWDASDALQIKFAANWWQDDSEIPAPLATDLLIQVPTSPVAPVLEDNLEIAEGSLDDNRAADWNVGGRYHPERDLDYDSLALTVVWDLNDQLTFTSLTSYAQYEDGGTYLPIDGTEGLAPELAVPPSTQPFNVEVTNGYSFADIDTFSQEFRLTGSAQDLDWIAGVYYSSDEVESKVINLGDMSTRGVIAPVYGLFLKRVNTEGTQDSDLWAAFGQLDWSLSDQFSLSAGLRYTDSSREYAGCTRDHDVLFEEYPGHGAAFFNNVIYGGAPVIAPGGCLTVTGFDPTSGFSSGLFDDTLDEDAWSGRLSLNYTPTDDMLLYGSISRGFKQGGFPTIPASSSSQLEPVTKETLTAFEVGIKSTLGEGATQLNGAVYYYDYEDKQLLGEVIDPIFNRLQALVNIPESTVWGGEIDFQSLITTDLLVTGSVSYVDTEVDKYFGVDINAMPQDFKGSSFPLTPEWQGTLGAQYTFYNGDDVTGDVGLDVVYSDDTNTGYQPAGESLDPRLDLDSYTTLDARIAFEDNTGTWRVMAWGRNLTDEDYRINALTLVDFYTRTMGMPRTYGVTVSYNWN